MPIGVPALSSCNQYGVVPCMLCEEDAHFTSNASAIYFTSPSVISNGKRCCQHVYVDGGFGYFFWNQDGSMYMRRADGSGLLTDKSGESHPHTSPPQPPKQPEDEIWA